MRRRGRRVLASGGVVILVAGLVGVGVARGLPGSVALGSAADLAGASASTVVEDATPRETWAGQVDPRRICAIVAMCTSAGRTGSVWRFTVAGTAPAVGEVAVPVTGRIVAQQPPTSMRMVLEASQAALGDLTATVDLRLAARGDDTVVRLDVVDAQASGLMDRVVAPALARNLQAGLDAWAGRINAERSVAGVRVAATSGTSARGPAVRSAAPAGDGPDARDGIVRARVSSASLAVARPTATGLLRVYDGDRVLCRAAVRDSRASCRFDGPDRPARLLALVTGRMSNGLQVWNSTTVRWTP